MKLIKFISFEGKIICETGLHIGGGNSRMKIGGVDNEVIKHPITQEPYIPGSSLKGKMRSQLEKINGTRNKQNVEVDNGEPCCCGKFSCAVCRIFGAHKHQQAASAPTRIIVRDAYLTEKTREEFKSILVEKGESYYELKTEHINDRRNGSANPRTIERVPAGAEFAFNIQLQVFDIDDEKLLTQSVVDCLKYVENSYLGGSGSRGYGKVHFEYDIKPIDCR